MQEGIKKGEIEEIVLENFSLERDFSFVALPDMLKTEKLFEICDVIKKFI